MKGGESGPEAEIPATLEMNDGSTRISVFVSARRIQGFSGGYLRLAYGQGNVINRLLSSVGQTARLVGPSGAGRPILLLSTDPKDAPGYLCTFAFKSGRSPLPRTSAVSPDTNGKPESDARAVS